MRVLIFCAGEAKRWKNDRPKQLVDVDGCPLLERTVSQVRARGYQPIVVAHEDVFGVLDAEVFRPKESTYNTDSVLATRCLWGDETLCLLGDVWFSEEALDTITTAAFGVKVFGRERPSTLTGGCGEIFAFRWDRANDDKVAEAMALATEHARTHPRKNTGRDNFGSPLGSLWQPYRALAGIDMDAHRTDATIWKEIDDWTDDFDSVEAYERWMQRRKARFIRL